MTRLTWGSAIHVGQVRQVNQDHLVTEEGLFAVADGMGGHRGGEVASELAVTALREHFTERTSAGLVAAVQAANDEVVAEAGRDPELRGMGTTLAVLALVEDGDHEVLSIANVGDSRIYLLRAESEDLEQITEDHSLVATLQRQGQLSKDEAATHPQRNIITRALGIDTTVLVDSWDIVPVRADRYLLCSDGLFNEVDDARIAATLRRLADPGEAAAELVRLANEHGGRDNISVVVVDVEDAAFTVGTAPGRDTEAMPVVRTGSGPAPVDAALADGTGAVADDSPAPAADGPDVASGDDAHPAEADATSASGGAPATPADAPATPDEAPVVDERAARPSRAERRRRRRAERRDGTRSRFTWRVVLFLVVLVGLAGATVALFVVAAGGTYYVAPDGDDVVIWKGRPEGVLWIDPEVAERPDPPLAVDDVRTEFRDDVVDGRDFGDLAAAQRYVERIRPEPTTTTTTTSTTTTTAPVTDAAPASGPAPAPGTP